MKPSHPKIRQLLHQYHDGLTAKEISERLEKKHDTIYAALQNMPDTYIDG
jgi:predicted transcriptional regulator